MLWMRASTTGSLGTANGSLSMITQLNCSPGTSTPCQNDEVANSTQFGVARNSSSSALRGAVPCSSVGIFDVERHAVVDQPHLLVAGEQHEGAPAAEPQNPRDLLARPPPVKPGCAGRADAAARRAAPAVRSRSGSARPASRAMSQAQPLPRELEAPRDGQRRRGQHHRVHLRRTASRPESPRRRSAWPAGNSRARAARSSRRRLVRRSPSRTRRLVAQLLRARRHSGITSSGASRDQLELRADQLERAQQVRDTPRRARSRNASCSRERPCGPPPSGSSPKNSAARVLAARRAMRSSSGEPNSLRRASRADVAPQVLRTGSC